jgi:outer membrane protein assembly factor BamB/predicted alpha/beta hydrolase
LRKAKLVVAGAIGLLVVGGLGFAAAHYYKHREPPQQKVVTGSSTREYVTTQKPVKKRPKKVVLEEPWPTYGFSVQRTHLADFSLRPPYRRIWTAKAEGLIEFPPVVAYDKVFLAQEFGRFFAYDARTGKRLWRKRFGHCAASSPTAAKGVVYQAYMQPFPCARGDRSARGFVVAMDAKTGRELWRRWFGAIESSLLYVKGVLYFGSWDNHVYALNATTHKVLWSYPTDAEVNTSGAYASGTVYFATDGGSLYALNAKTGRLRWLFDGGREYFYATPTVAYGRVYIGNTDGTLYAFGASSGHLLWAQHVGTYVYSAAAVYRNTVYVGSYDGGLYAFDAGTGVERWRYDSPSAIHGSPTVMDGVVYFANCHLCGSRASRYAKVGPVGTYGLDAETGKLLWHFPDGAYSPIVADKERVYLAGLSKVYGFEPESALRARRAARLRRVHFRAGDGVLLDGRMFGRGKTGVVLSHMGRPGDSQADWAPVARALAADGFAALTYDRRGVCPGGAAGCSQGVDDYTTSWRDVVGAVRYLHALGVRRVFLVGASIGAMSSLYAVTSRKAEAAGLVEIGGINDASGYSFSRQDLRQARGRKLFVSSVNDVYGGAGAARQWYDWARQPKRLVLLPGDRHGTDMLAEPSLRSRLIRLIADFVRGG